jgi:hypothetical protein
MISSYPWLLLSSFSWKFMAAGCGSEPPKTASMAQGESTWSKGSYRAW